MEILKRWLGLAHDDTEEQVRAGCFEFRIYRQLAGRECRRNLFISPLSISLALALLANGAAFDTRDEVLDLLDEEDLKEMNEAYARLQRQLVEADSQVQLDIANSLWSNVGSTFQPEFEARMRELYQAELATLDFASPDAAARINNWVSERTHGKISGLLDGPALLQGGLAVLNAVYFKAAWTKQFDRRRTVTRPFTCADGSARDQAMMYSRNEYAYYENEKFQAVCLPYGEEKLAMYVFLPAPGVGVDGFHRLLGIDNWNVWLARLAPLEGTVIMPRFRLDESNLLGDAMQALGVKSAFSPEEADFSLMLTVEGGERVCIGPVLHRACVEVNEEGTEAAAVTGIGRPMAYGLQGSKSFELIADRPFCFAICHQETKTVLFLGAVNDPQE